METEIITTNPAPSPLDQAYKKYQNDLRTRITGAESDQDLIKGIIDSKIPREKIAELKKQTITPEVFKSYYYYPRELFDGVKLRENYTGREILENNFHINNFQILPDDRILSVDAYGQIRLFISKLNRDGYDQREIDQNNMHMPINSVQMLPNNSIVSCIGIGDQHICIWIPRSDGSGYDREEVGKHKGGVVALQILPDNMIASGDTYGCIYLWTPKPDGSGYEKKEVGRQEYSLATLQVLSNGKIVSAGDNQICIWTPRSDGSGYDKKEVGFYGGNRIRSICALLDGRIVCGGYDGQIYLWTPKLDGSGYKPQKVGEHEHIVATLQILSSGEILSGGFDGQLCLWIRRNDGSYDKNEVLKCTSEDTDVVNNFQILPDGRIVTGVGNKIFMLE